RPRYEHAAHAAEPPGQASRTTRALPVLVLGVPPSGGRVPPGGRQHWRQARVMIDLRLRCATGGSISDSVVMVKACATRFETKKPRSRPFQVILLITTRPKMRSPNQWRIMIIGLAYLPTT